MKILLPMAYTQTMLCWGALMFPQGYKDANALVGLRTAIIWGAKYLVKGHKQQPDREMIYQVGINTAYLSFDPRSLKCCFLRLATSPLTMVYGSAQRT